jgi:enediyne biosynthesis protein E4
VDLDNDGWLDLVTVNGHIYPQIDSLRSTARYREPTLVQLNQGDGTFCDASDQSGPAILLPQVSSGLAIGGLFNDGNMDLVIENLDGTSQVLRNQGIPGQHWVGFQLAGKKSNRMAIGARLKLTAGAMTQTEEVHSGGSYQSQSDQRIHFGLQNRQPGNPSAVRQNRNAAGSRREPFLHHPRRPRCCSSTENPSHHPIEAVALLIYRPYQEEL